jgi:hypothetical protein
MAMFLPGFFARRCPDQSDWPAAQALRQEVPMGLGTHGAVTSWFERL